MFTSTALSFSNTAFFRTGLALLSALTVSAFTVSARASSLPDVAPNKGRIAASFDLSEAKTGGVRQQAGNNERICTLGESVKIAETAKGLQMFLSDLALQLAVGDSALAGRANCRLVVPLSVPVGFYPASVLLRTAYFVEKDANATTNMAIAASLFGYTFPIAKRGFEWGESASRNNAELLNTTVTNQDEKAMEAFCTGRAAKGLLTLNLAVTAARDSLNTNAEMGLGREKNALEIELGEWLPCPK